ncbi:Permease of the drug/metabolite transporter (DMT) superfamily [Dethiosulfatibacter aminovorans DSM 17477]|uniref:Permease of the drug/metabolite transporter (DMT) superfamily n=1 Tax=Dethiosulfatibacter aminovorans DSM 17477 TaxID=1121476 RepID=A0A1M6M3S3_9FIRM|nr:DMT family transporter [Dethiosulfatibacter aminovorans]SHJ78168.1 Permease of the drug/metabolite transporter (DMT) superfamily [Dethiosulfatibacter aminovorans DSM 17477]
MKKNEIIALTLVTIASIIWGVSFVSKEVLMAEIHPGSLIAFQFIWVSIILGIYNFLIKKRFTITKKDFFSLAGTGIIGMFLYNVFINMGIRDTNSSIVSVLLSLIPIICLFVERIVYKRHFSGLKVICILGSIIGVYMIIGSGGMGSGGSLAGYMYIIIGVFFWVAFCFISDKYYSRYDTTEILMVQGLGAVAVSFVYLIIYPIHLGGIDLELFLHFFVIIILNACLSFAFYIYSIRELGVTVTNVFNNVVPVVTLFVNIVVFDVEIGLMSLIGTGVIITSVAILNIFDKRRDECDMNLNVESKYAEAVNQNYNEN